MPKEDDIDDGEWKEFEIEFNTAVDNLRKVAEEKFKNKDTTKEFTILQRRSLLIDHTV